MDYPFFIDLEGKNVLVAGGGNVGARRAKYLQAAGAKVTVVSTEFLDELLDLELELVNADLSTYEIDYTEFFLVVAATDDKGLNAKITRKARNSNTLVCNASEHLLGDVVFPMITNVSNHTLAYTTLGENPKLLKKIKKLIEDEFEP